MWPGPYGDLGSRKYLLASLDQSLRRMGLDYVDIFYSHRFDPETPLEETMGALDAAVRQGKALYVGISPTVRARPRRRSRSSARWASRCSSTSPRTRCSTAGSSRSCSTCSGTRGSAASRSRRSPRGCSPTSTSTACPRARVRRGRASPRTWSTREEHRGGPRRQRDRARRGQTLAQMAIASRLRRRDRAATSAVGASSGFQLEQNLAALEHPDSTIGSWPRSTRDARLDGQIPTSGPAPARPDARARSLTPEAVSLLRVDDLPVVVDGRSAAVRY